MQIKKKKKKSKGFWEVFNRPEGTDRAGRWLHFDKGRKCCDEGGGHENYQPRLWTEATVSLPGCSIALRKWANSGGVKEGRSKKGKERGWGVATFIYNCGGAPGCSDTTARVVARGARNL